MNQKQVYDGFQKGRYVPSAGEIIEIKDLMGVWHQAIVVSVNSIFINVLINGELHIAYVGEYNNLWRHPTQITELGFANFKLAFDEWKRLTNENRHKQDISYDFPEKKENRYVIIEYKIKYE